MVRWKAQPRKTNTGQQAERGQQAGKGEGEGEGRGIRCPGLNKTTGCDDFAFVGMPIWITPQAGAVEYRSGILYRGMFDGRQKKRRNKTQQKQNKTKKPPPKKKEGEKKGRGKKSAFTRKFFGVYLHIEGFTRPNQLMILAV